MTGGRWPSSAAFSSSSTRCLPRRRDPSRYAGCCCRLRTPSGPSVGPDGIGSVRIPQLAQRWPGPLVEGYVTLGPADAQTQGLQPAPTLLPEGRGRLRNGAYALQWWLFAGFTLVMAVRMARDVGRSPAPGPALDVT